LRTLEKVAATLDDSDKGDNEQWHQLHHGPNLSHPAEEHNTFITNISKHMALCLGSPKQKQNSMPNLYSSVMVQFEMIQNLPIQ
jgi:hypothetical protein